MGNRNANARRKQRDNAYVYTDNRRNEYAADNKVNGSINRRLNQQAQPFNYHSYPNGYGVNPTIPQTNSYPPKSNSNASSRTRSECFFFVSR